MKIFFEFILYTSIFFSSTGCTQDKFLSPKQTIYLYMNSWKSKDYESVWRISSPRVKQSMENDKKNFIKYIIDNRVIYSNYKILSEEIQKNSAYFVLDVEYSGVDGSSLGGEREKCHLVLVDRFWYIDDCMPLQK